MVRRAVKTDVTSIAQMAVMMWDVHSVEELAREFETLIENEECEIYICCIDNMPIGFAQCGLRHDYVEGTESSPVGYLEGIFVCEEYRKKDMPGSCWTNAKNGPDKKDVLNLQVIVS